MGYISQYLNVLQSERDIQWTSTGLMYRSLHSCTWSMVCWFGFVLKVQVFGFRPARSYWFQNNISGRVTTSLIVKPERWTCSKGWAVHSNLAVRETAVSPYQMPATNNCEAISFQCRIYLYLFWMLFERRDRHIFCSKLVLLRGWWRKGKHFAVLWSVACAGDESHSVIVFDVLILNFSFDFFPSFVDIQKADLLLQLASH